MGRRNTIAGNPHHTPESYECCWPNCEKRVEAKGPPLCERHLFKAAMAYLTEYGFGQLAPTTSEAARLEARMQLVHEAQEQGQQRRAEREAAYSQVYYVRIGDHVKIGYTINLKQRLSALRVNADALLAAEPGGAHLERERHLQFAVERIGVREDFTPSPRLLAHIKDMRQAHGEPRMTGHC